MFRERLHAGAHFCAIVAAAVLVGAISGLGSWALFESLDQATSLRLDHAWLIYLLPVAALLLGLAYHYAGGEAAKGTSLVIDRSLPPTASAANVSGDSERADAVSVPARMAPMIFGSTYLAQLTGASVGREGAALQIAGSLASLAMKPFRIAPSDARLMLVAAMAGAFGGAFGVPIAGAVFALEVQQTGRLRYDALAPALIASVTADFVVEGLGRSTPVISFSAPADWWVFARLALVGIAAGAAARLFIRSLHVMRSATGRLISWAPLRPVVGAVATIGLAVLVGSDYLGLSLPLVDDALAGITSDWWDPALKILFTVIALGSGIPGGEVTPLFVIGATLGSVLSAPLDLGPTLAAVAASAAVFGAASNTPIACTLLTAELFGTSVLAPAGIVCIFAYAVSPSRGIYESQRLGAFKDLRAIEVRRPHA